MKRAAKLCTDPHTGRQRPLISEDAEQSVVVEWLERRGVEFHHSPNGGARPSKLDKKGNRYSNEGAKLKRLGTRAGFPDLIILDPPPKVPGATGAFLEMKALDGTATEEQTAFIKRREAQGWPCCVARGANVAIAFLTNLGY